MNFTQETFDSYVKENIDELGQGLAHQVGQFYEIKLLELRK